MPKQILFIKAIKPPQANRLAPIVDKLKGLVDELANAAGTGGGDGSDGGDQASQQALDQGDTNTDPAQGANTDDDGSTGDDPQNGPGTGDGADGGAGGGASGDTQDDQTNGETPGSGGGDATDPAAAGSQFGPHNVEPGHHIAFQAGDFKGAGKVTASGEDGCTAQDKSGREHRVHYHEITGHNDAAAAAGAKPAPKDGKGTQRKPTKKP